MEENALINQIDCDVRAEVVAANFIENLGVSIDKISINNKGSRERAYSKDIIKAEYRPTQLSRTDILNIDVTRSGIYDLLPQGFFHGNSDPGRSKKKTTGDAIEEIKRHRTEEEAMRRFFEPIEREINRMRIVLEQAERGAVMGLVDSEQNDLFTTLFPDIMEVEEIHRNALIQVIPVVHRIRGNRDLIAPLMAFLFNIPARIKSLKQFRLVENKGSLNVLGTTFAGENFIIGNYIPDYSPQLEVQLGPIKREEAIKFQPGGSLYKLIGFIKKYLVPFDSEIKLSLVFHENEKGLYLSESQNTDRIGLNTYL